MTTFLAETINGEVLAILRYDADTNEQFFDCYVNDNFIGEAYGDTEEEVKQYIEDILM